MANDLCRLKGRREGILGKSFKENPYSVSNEKFNFQLAMFILAIRIDCQIATQKGFEDICEGIT